MKLIGSIFLRYVVNGHTETQTDRQTTAKYKKPAKQSMGGAKYMLYQLERAGVA